MSTELTLGIYKHSIGPGEVRNLYDAIERAANDEEIVLVRYGKRIRLVLEEPALEPAVFSWCPGDKPPLDAIAKAIAEVLGRGREACMREYVPGDDRYWWIVADRAVDDDEAERLCGTDS